jgi:hypothetical protein
MSTIQVEINVSDETLARYGAQALAERFQKMVAWEELSVQARAIKNALDEEGLDWEELLEESRQKAWETYKYTIKDKLPPEAFQ